MYLKVYYFFAILFSLSKFWQRKYESLCVGLISRSAILFLVEDKQCTSLLKPEPRGLPLSKKNSTMSIVFSCMKTALE